MASLIVEPDRPRKPFRVDWYQGRHRTKRFASRREAEAFIGDLARGRRVGGESPRLEVWVPRWIAEHGPTWERRTRKERAADLDRWVLPYLGHVRLRDLSRSDVRAWRAQAQADGATAYRAQRALTILSACLGAAVDAELLDVNPCAGVRALDWERTFRDPVPLDLVEALRLELPAPRDRALVSLLAYAGLRPSEAVALDWSDVHEDAVVVRRGGRASGRTKTGNRRTVPMIPALRRDLVELGRRPAGSVLEITGWHNYAGRVLRPARAAAGVDGDAYALRHTAASLWIAEHRTVLEVAQLLGHSSSRLTHDTYGHLFDVAQLRPAESAAQAVDRARRRAPAARRKRKKAEEAGR